MSSLFSTVGSVNVNKNAPTRYSLNSIEASNFVQELKSNSSLLGRVKVIPMKRSRIELPAINVNTSTFTPTVLTSTALVLPWSISRSTISSNSAAASKRVLALSATMAANDLEDLMINGDNTSADALLGSTDGVCRKINKTCATGYGGFSFDIFENTLQALPTEYKRTPEDLTYLVGPDMWQGYISSLARRSTPNTSNLANMAPNPTYAGIEIMMVPAMPKNKIILTELGNLIFGIQDTIDVTAVTPATPTRLSSSIHLAIKLRVAFGLVNENAAVLTTYKTT